MKGIGIAVLVLIISSGSELFGQDESVVVAETSTGMVIEEAEQVSTDKDGEDTRASALGTAFTYQGQLNDAGVPANGQYDMQFALYDDGGVLVAGPICLDNVECVDGLFTVEIDFGAFFTGDARKLDIAVRPGGDYRNCDNGDPYTSLAPRQPLTAAPYALGLRFPFAGNSDVAGDSVAVQNVDLSDHSTAIRGIIGDSVATIPFIDRAGVRGDSTVATAAGVIGVSDEYVGVFGYTVGGENKYGVFGRADGTGGTGVWGWANGASGKGVFGRALKPDSYAGYFEGRGYFSGNVGIGTVPTAELEVDGTLKTTDFQMETDAAEGRVLTSDAEGNGTWQDIQHSVPTSAFSTGQGTVPTATKQFLSTTVTITITDGQSIFVVANQSFGSTAAGGASDLDLYIGYRLAGAGTLPNTAGGGMYNMRVPQYARIPMGLNGIISGLPAGTYEVGMVGDDDGNGNWNSIDWGYVSVLVLN